jgi:acetyltransferase-like isoleucine patch superfamily enzyme
MAAWAHLERLAPALGLIGNAVRFPGLRCGLRVEISGSGHFRRGTRVNLGEGSRIELAPGSALDIGDNVSISRFVHIAPSSSRRVSIESGTTVQDYCRIYGDVAIGPRCILAPNVFVSSGTHAFDALPHLPIQCQEQLAPIEERPIRIFGDCWFGINAVVLPGVTVGRGCVVGANAVVTNDLPPYAVAVGSPARVARQRLQFVPKSRIEAANENDAPYFYDGFGGDLLPNGGAFAASSAFILALQSEAARAVRLGLEGEDGVIGLEGQCQSVPKGWSVVEFPLGQTSRLSPFLRFQLDGHCRIKWAELVA